MRAIKFKLTSPWVNCGICQVMSEEDLGYSVKEWENLSPESQEQRLELWREEQQMDISLFWQKVEVDDDDEVDVEGYNC